MKSITFTVEIQADFNERGLGKTASAKELCNQINEILTTHYGTIAGAQIMSRPKAIKVIAMPED
jgi:hypothetical protein